MVFVKFKNGRKKFLERIMNDTILFPFNSFVRGKLDSSLACENMDFVKHFLYNLRSILYQEILTYCCGEPICLEV